MATVTHQSHYVNIRPSAPRACPSQLPVPTEGTQFSLFSSSILLRLKNPSAGTPPAIRGVGQLRRHYDSLYPALLVLLGTPQRAELAKRALYVQAMRGDCFLGAKGLARKVGCSEKTWDRTLTWLREHKLARTWRLYRVNGQRSVNLLDLGRLWALIR